MSLCLMVEQNQVLFSVDFQWNPVLKAKGLIGSRVGEDQQLFGLIVEETDGVEGGLDPETRDLFGVEMSRDVVSLVP